MVQNRPDLHLARRDRGLGGSPHRMHPDGRPRRFQSKLGEFGRRFRVSDRLGTRRLARSPNKLETLTPFLSARRSQQAPGRPARQQGTPGGSSGRSSPSRPPGDLLTRRMRPPESRSAMPLAASFFSATQRIFRTPRRATSMAARVRARAPGRGSHRRAQRAAGKIIPGPSASAAPAPGTGESPAGPRSRAQPASARLPAASASDSSTAP